MVEEAPGADSFEAPAEEIMLEAPTEVARVVVFIEARSEETLE